MCRAAACLTCWGGAVLRGLSQIHALAQPFTQIRDWSRVSDAAAPTVQEDEGLKATQKGGKKPATPAEEPKTPGPPVDALVACVNWVCFAVHGSHSAARAACDMSASHFINLLKHPSPEVINASLLLIKALLRQPVFLQALVMVCTLLSRSLDKFIAVFADRDCQAVQLPYHSGCTVSVFTFRSRCLA